MFIPVFSKEELNAMGVIISNAPIKGSDAAFIAALLAKIERMTKEENAPAAPTAE